MRKFKKSNFKVLLVIVFTKIFLVKTEFLYKSILSFYYIVRIKMARQRILPKILMGLMICTTFFIFDLNSKLNVEQEPLKGIDKFKNNDNKIIGKEKINKIVSNQPNLSNKKYTI